MKSKYFVISTSIFGGAFIAGAVKAVCPVCVVVVGAGLGLSRWLGVDDIVSSIWIGGLLWAISAWTVIWLKTKDWRFKYYETLIPVAYYLLVLGPLYFSEIIGHPQNKIWGTDKIVFGATIGTFVFVGATMFHNFLKTKNNGKSFFQYQKVVLPFLSLFIISLIFYFLISWI